MTLKDLCMFLFSTCVMIVAKANIVSVVWRVRRSVVEVDLTTGAPSRMSSSKCQWQTLHYERWGTFRTRAHTLQLWPYMCNTSVLVSPRVVFIENTWWRNTSQGTGVTFGDGLWACFFSFSLSAWVHNLSNHIVSWFKMVANTLSKYYSKYTYCLLDTNCSIRPYCKHCATNIMNRNKFQTSLLESTSLMFLVNIFEMLTFDHDLFFLPQCAWPISQHWRDPWRRGASTGWLWEQVWIFLFYFYSCYKLQESIGDLGFVESTI